jgi:hypothetical protein
MREKIILIVGLLCCSCLSALANSDDDKYRPIPNASMKQIQKQIQASGHPAISVMPIFSQVVAFTLPNGFNPVFENAQGPG